MEPNAPVVHADASDNLSAQFVSEYGPVDATFANAPHVFKASFWQHRGVAHSIECRGCVAAVDALSDKLTLWSSTQTPLVAARILADILDRDEKLIRVVTPEVGGAFGPKLVFYPEEAAVAVATLLLGRPIKWIEDRREHFVATTQERDQYWDAEIAVDGEGKILGVRGTLLHDHGAYTARGLTMPQGAVAALTLAYVVPAYRMGVKVALTNKVPVTPIRGAGQPQGVFVMERLLDLAARELKNRPRRNPAAQSRAGERHALHQGLRDARRRAGDARQRRLSRLPGECAGAGRMGWLCRTPGSRPAPMAAISASVWPIMSKAQDAALTNRSRCASR